MTFMNHLEDFLTTKFQKSLSIHSKQSIYLTLPTPTVEYDKQLWVKQDFLCFPSEPKTAKMRGLSEYLAKFSDKHVLVKLFTPFNAISWGIAKLWKGIKVFLVPRWNRPHTLTTYYLIKILLENSLLVPVPCLRYKVLDSIIHKHFQQLPNVFVFPINPLMDECRESLRKEVLLAQWEIVPKTIVVPTSTANMVSGIIRGINELGWDSLVIAHLCGNRNVSFLRHRIETLSQSDTKNVQIVNEGYTLYQPIEEKEPWNPCNPAYDLKSWIWLKRNWKDLEKPVLFWAIG